MNKAKILLLKGLRKTYEKLIGYPKISKPDCIQDPDVASELIYNLLMQDKPCMIARFGSTELATMVNHLGVKNGKKDIWGYIQGKGLPWWWNENMFLQMQNWSGFFPPTQENIERFCEMMLVDIEEIDILGSWLADENQFNNHTTQSVHLRLLEPFWSNIPWTRALKGKRILIVHPFAKSILTQYENRGFLFAENEMLPTFKSIRVIQAVQSLGGENGAKFRDWFEALEAMKNQINEEDFDICLIGAGAYGLPLAAHVKRMGKKAVHLGGALQLLFGIKGKRWEDPNYGVKEWGIPKDSYTSLINEYWVRPTKDETPDTATNVEGACYW